MGSTVVLGKTPYSKYPRSREMKSAVKDGYRMEKPTDCDDNLWVKFAFMWWLQCICRISLSILTWNQLLLQISLAIPFFWADMMIPQVQRRRVALLERGTSAPTIVWRHLQDAGWFVWSGRSEWLLLRQRRWQRGYAKHLHQLRNAKRPAYLKLSIQWLSVVHENRARVYSKYGILSWRI